MSNVGYVFKKRGQDKSNKIEENVDEKIVDNERNGSRIKRVKTVREEISCEGILSREVEDGGILERGEIGKYLGLVIGYACEGKEEDREVVKKMRDYLKKYSDDFYAELLKIIEQTKIDKKNRICSFGKRISMWRSILGKYEFDCSEGCCRERTVTLLKEIKDSFWTISGNEKQKKVVNETFVSWVMLVRELARMGIIGDEGMWLLNEVVLSGKLKEYVEKN